MSDLKEGVDFEWVLVKNQPKGGTAKTRRFLNKSKKVTDKPVQKAALVDKKTAKPVIKKKPEKQIKLPERPVSKTPQSAPKKKKTPLPHPKSEAVAKVNPVTRGAIAVGGFLGSAAGRLAGNISNSLRGGGPKKKNSQKKKDWSFETLGNPMGD